MSSQVHKRFVVALAVLFLGCVGCAPIAAEISTSNAPSTTDAAPKDPTGQDEKADPSPAPSSIVLPDCDTANLLAAQEGADFFASIDMAIPEKTGLTDLEVFTRLAGPVAQAAMVESAETKACYWPLYIAGHSVTQYSTTIPEGSREALVGSLRDSDFAESSLEAAIVFTHRVDDPTNYRMHGTTTIQYAFLDEVWIAIFETGESDYLPSALDGLLASNPQLGD